MRTVRNYLASAALVLPSAGIAKLRDRGRVPVGGGRKEPRAFYIVLPCVPFSFADYSSPHHHGPSAEVGNWQATKQRHHT